jgi:hypothetical protein
MNAKNRTRNLRFGASWGMSGSQKSRHWWMREQTRRDAAAGSVILCARGGMPYFLYILGE